MRAQLDRARKGWAPLHLSVHKKAAWNSPLELPYKDWGLRFWYFDSLSPENLLAHGEDDGTGEKSGWMKLDPAAITLKTEFKARIEQVEKLINAEQRREIIQEAKTVFDSMKSIVLEMAAAGVGTTGQGKPIGLVGARDSRKRQIAMASANQPTNGHLIPIPHFQQLWESKPLSESTPFIVVTRLIWYILPFWILNLFLNFLWLGLSLLVSRISVIFPLRLPYFGEFAQPRLEEA